MNQLIKDYCDAVCLKVKHASNREKIDITKELSDHIQDHQEYLICKGYSEEAALKEAVASMGDPIEVGTELNKQYPLLWRVLSIIPLVIAISLFFHLFSIPFILGNIYDNYLARTNPQKEFNQVIERDYEVNYRIEYPEDNVLYIYGIEIESRTDNPFHSYYDSNIYYNYLVSISACCYTKNPFGSASTAIFSSTEFSNLNGEKYHHYAGFFSNVSQVRINVPVNFEDPCIYLDYSAFGIEIHEKLPLNWEVIK